jgi:glycosyltransferase involved in cell wall biosynthesis
VDTPLVLTSHVEVAPEVVRALADRPEVSVVAVSEHQAAQLSGVAAVTVIRHGIDVRAFPFAPEAGSYLLFLGRMLADKGPAEAIHLAQAADMPLVLAGGAEDGYDVTTEPAVDGERIRYAGRVGSEERNRLLAGAAALVFPAVYAEPFGLVLIEAMACGTPVLATALGAAPEIVEDGVTGWTAATWQELAEHAGEAAALDRAAIRRVAEERWDHTRMAAEHEALYRRVARG